MQVTRMELSKLNGWEKASQLPHDDQLRAT